MPLKHVNEIRFFLVKLKYHYNYMLRNCDIRSRYSVVTYFLDHPLRRSAGVVQWSGYGQNGDKSKRRQTKPATGPE